MRTYLELVDPGALPSVAAPDASARVERVAGCPASFFRFLYVEVGRDCQWQDRLGWTDEQIRERLADPGVSLHLLSVAGSPAGYFELQRHAQDGSVEIAYFGLLPEFRGRGLGGYLLAQAVGAAWRLAASRVWLHTCTLDDPAALPNYQARGFRPFRTESYEADVPWAAASRARLTPSW